MHFGLERLKTLQSNSTIIMTIATAKRTTYRMSGIYAVAVMEEIIVKCVMIVIQVTLMIKICVELKLNKLWLEK